MDEVVTGDLHDRCGGNPHRARGRQAMLGHPANLFIVHSLIWSAVIVLVFAPIAIARYRLG